MHIQIHMSKIQHQVVISGVKTEEGAIFLLHGSKTHKT